VIQDPEQKKMDSEIMRLLDQQNQNVEKINEILSRLVDKDKNDKEEQ